LLLEKKRRKSDKNFPSVNKYKENMKISDKYLFSNPNDLMVIKKALADKKISGTSDVVNEYENELLGFFGSKYAVATSSGTAALQTALSVLGVGRNDEVVVSCTAPSMTVFPIIYVGAKIIFCDTDNNNFGLNIDDLKKIITPKTKVVVEVPMWGYPTNARGLQKILKPKNIPLILDLAQAHGTKINDHYLSHCGDISCFSTHDRKILATGEGGFILTDNRNYYKKAKSFIQFGNMDGINLGLNYKLGSLQAALGSSRIKHIAEQLNVRKNSANYITSNIRNPRVKELAIVQNGKPNYYSLLLKLNFNNNLKFIEFLDANGIPSDIIRYNYKVLYKYPIFNKFKRVCPNSEKLVQAITTIPVHPGISKDNLDYIIAKINGYYEE
jgi:perosamine synthetase